MGWRQEIKAHYIMWLNTTNLTAHFESFCFCDHGDFTVNYHKLQNRLLSDFGNVQTLTPTKLLKILDCQRKTVTDKITDRCVTICKIIINTTGFYLCSLPERGMCP